VYFSESRRRTKTN